MKLNKQAVLSFKNFSKLSNDIMILAKEIMPDKIIYINFLNDEVQVTLKVSKHNTKVNVSEGETIDVMDAVCNQIDYKGGKPLIIEDAKNVDFADNIKDTIKVGNLGSYLGIPILFKDGSRFGALCAAHHDKSSFLKKDITLLEKIARLFSYYLELENIAYKDALTSLGNSQYLSIQQKNILKNGGLAIMLDLDFFKAINDNLGHHVGDLVLKEAGKKIRLFSLNFNNVYPARLGGDEFFIYIEDDLSEKQINDLLRQLIDDLSRWETEIKDCNLSSSAGAYLFKGNEFTRFTDLFEKVDRLLYEAKNKGRSNYVFKSSK